MGSPGIAGHVDSGRGATLVVTLLSLLVYALDISLILAFGVARCQRPDGSPGRADAASATGAPPAA